MMLWSRRESPSFWRISAFVVVVAIPTASFAETGGGERVKVHEVRRGDTLASIAQRHGVTVDDLAATNDLNPEKALTIGEQLTLPRPGTGRFHVVRTGETAAQIARSSGCSVEELSALNKLGPSARLDVGQVLKLPQSPSVGHSVAPTATKGRHHVVKSGESLNEIAHAYGVGTKILMRANSISNPKTLRPGTSLLIPDPRTAARMKGGKRVSPIRRSRRVSAERHGNVLVHHVMDGQSWKVLARAYKTTIAKLQAANRNLGKRLDVGDAVRVPERRDPVAVQVANCGYPGIRFIRREKQRTIPLMTCKGGVSGQGRRLLSKMAVTPGEQVKTLLHPQLIRRLQRVADEFPGRTFQIVSGYRPPRGERGSSRHHVGRALDFSIQGVPNKQLFNFCLQLPSTGCGYYPNSTFIHLDYRSESAHWTDLSGPGEPANYAPRQGSDADETTTDSTPSEPSDGNGS